MIGGKGWEGLGRDAADGDGEGGGRGGSVLCHAAFYIEEVGLWIYLVAYVGFEEFF